MAEDTAAFLPLDRERDIEVRQRNLPHWFQTGAAIFVTFRTIDSLPKEALLRMQRELEEWLRVRKLPTHLAASAVMERHADHDQLMSTLETSHRAEFRRLMNRLFHWFLDECHGRCILRRRELAEIVAKAIQHDNGVKFGLDRFVIMPNHVHALVQFRSGFDLSVVGHSWMRYTARQINNKINSSGAFWAPEPFDHIVRSAEQFVWTQDYIAENPQKAKLRDGEYLLWIRDEKPRITEK